MSEKVKKIKSLNDLIDAAPSEVECEIDFGNGNIRLIDLLVLNKDQMDEINSYYEDKKPSPPKKWDRSDKTKNPILVEDTESDKYKEYQKKLKDIVNKSNNAMVVSFLPEEIRPEVNVNTDGLNEQDAKFAKLEAQGDKFSKMVGAGVFLQFLTEGTRASGFKQNVDEKIEQAKNS